VGLVFDKGRHTVGFDVGKDLQLASLQSESLGFQTFLEGDRQVEGIHRFWQGDIEMQAPVPARAGQKGAGNADGLQGGTDLGDAVGGAIVAAGIDIEQAVDSFSAEPHPNQDVGILPVVPQYAGAQCVLGIRRPGGFGGGIIRQLGVDGAPQVAAKGFTQALAQGVSGEKGIGSPRGNHQLPPG
jgi:hypothetical protein